ncbi:MAG: type II secretion system F family protein, partial [Hydrogenobaculum sp.]
SLEPMATLIVGALVSLVVLSIMLPIVDIASSVH